MKLILTLLVITTSLLSIDFDDINYNCDVVLKRQMYSTCYNTTLKMPNYSFYKIINSSADVTMERLNTFYVDPNLSKDVRSNNDDYGIYDKGHLAPASLMDLNENSRKEANYLSNVVPQDAYLNRFGAWRDIERLEQILVNSYNLDIISGAVFKDSSVPTHMYKVIVIPSIKKYIILYYTNTSIDKKYKYDYMINIPTFESKTNIHLNIPTDYIELTKQELIQFRP